MPFDGNGTFVRTDGTFTGPTVFQQERDASIDILASNLDTEAQDMADGLSNCITRDGQSPPTANLPMGGFTFTGLGAGTAGSSSITVTQVQTQAVINAGAFGGTANALTGTLTPSIAAYTTRMRIVGTATATVTGASTLALNGIAAPPAIRKKLAGGLAATTGGEWIAGQTISFTYDGTYWVLDDKIEWQASASIASATTTDLSASTGEYVEITGSTTITAFGTLPAGTLRVLRYASTPSVTYNGTSLILAGAVSRTMAAGDIQWLISEGAGNWREVGYQPAVGPQLSQGRQVLSIGGSALVANTTDGAVSSTAETATNDVMLSGYSFSNSVTAYAQFSWPSPPSWNAGTVTFRPRWYAASGSGDVRWYLRAVAISNGDALDAAFGTAQTSTDTLTGANQLCIGPESSAITIAGTPAKSDQVVFQVYRIGGGTGDTLAAAAILLGLDVFITLNAPNEA